MGAMVQLRCQRCHARLFDATDKLVNDRQPTPTIAIIKCHNCGYKQRVYERAVAKGYEVS